MHVQTAGSQRWSSMWITSYYRTSTLQFDSLQFWSIMGSLSPAAGIQLWTFNNVKFTWGLSYLHDIHNIQGNLGSQYFIPTSLWHHFLSPFLSPVYTKFKPVKGLDTFIVKRLQILMVSSFLSAPQKKSYFLSGSSFLLDIRYSWVLENWLDYSRFFFFFLTSRSLLPGLTTNTISKSWVTQSRSVHRGFLGIYPSSHVLKDWISWLMHMQAPLILCCLWQHFWTKAVVASLNKDLYVQRFHLAR